MQKYIVALLALPLLLVTACDGESPEASDPMDFREADVADVTIRAVGDNMQFEQTSFTVRPGQTVQLVMDNAEASLPHNVLVVNSDDNSVANEVYRASQDEGPPNYIPDHGAVLASTPMASGGEVTEVEFTAPEEPGDYIYLCTYPGHYPAMTGVMEVRTEED